METLVTKATDGKSIVQRVRRARRRLIVATSRQSQEWTLALVAGFEVAVLFVAFVAYLRMHGIDILQAIACGCGVSIGGFGFVSASIGLASTVEVVFWSAIATTLRWLHSAVMAGRKGEFQPVRHMIEWGEDVISTPILAAVIVYGLRTPRISFGQAVNLSLNGVDIGWFIVLGFLMGFFGQSPRSILNQIRNRTLPNRNGSQPEAQSLGQVRSRAKLQEKPAAA